MRSLYGPEGLLTELEDQSKVKQRQNPSRVSQLILRAAWHGLDSCWICQHPVLLLGGWRFSKTSSGTVNANLELTPEWESFTMAGCESIQSLDSLSATAFLCLEYGANISKELQGPNIQAEFRSET